MTSPIYQPLSDLIEEDQDFVAYTKKQKRGLDKITCLLVLEILFAVSVGFNIYAAVWYHASGSDEPQVKTRYGSVNEALELQELALLITISAQLTQTRPLKWTTKNEWHNGNQTHEDAIWDQYPGFHSRESVVALSHSYADSVGLPRAQDWPRDENKGIYVIEGLHIMHCVKYLRKNVYEIHQGKTPTATFAHLTHCVDALRQFVMCHADDTPRYTGRIHDSMGVERPYAGIGQARMCKDWGQLIDWAKRNSACYRYVPDTIPGFQESDRYRSCPIDN